MNLAQRIDVLKQFERTPDIGHLARKYQCGRRQIKNILRKRKKYLAMWSRNLTEKPNYQSSCLNAVGIILNEWVKRARCYKLKINDDILRKFGQEIAENIKFVDFKPTNAWLQQFKQKYKLPDVQLTIKQGTDSAAGNKEPLSISSIIEDLRRKHGNLMIVPLWELKDDVENGDSRPTKRAGNASTKSSALPSPDSAMQLENEELNILSDDSYDEDVKMEVAREIESYKEALNQLGPLEQFALMRENIRAVGLINQLENLFREEMEKTELS